MRIAVIIFIYESAVKYFNDLSISLNIQTNKDFEVIFFNDNVREPNKYFSCLNMSYSIRNLSSKTPIELRYEGLMELINDNFDYYIFQDCDDFLDKNRVEIVTCLASTYKLISNDLTLVDESGQILDDFIWKKRLNKRIFTHENLESFNFVGLGNTSISKSLLKYLPSKPLDNFEAIDWYIFYNILKESKAIGYFTSETAIFYRQHPENTIGALNSNKLEQIIKTRKKFNDLIGFSTQLKDIKLSLPKSKKHSFPFWWELKTS